MNTELALEFLRNHQPMPNDDQVGDDDMKMYNSIREFFLGNPDFRCVPLFLNSFGYVDGFGVYQLIEKVISGYDDSEVIPHLVEALANEKGSVQYWCSQIAGGYPDESLVEPLFRVYQSSQEFDFRDAAIRSLGFMNSPRAKVLLEQALENEEDSEMVDVIQETLDDM